MRNEAPGLLPLLRSNFQGELLALLLLDPESEWTLSEIARSTSANISVVHREVERLVLAGVARDRRVGRARLIRANPGYELFEPLSELILRSFGPQAALRTELAHVTGVELAFIYGSWAARYAGEPGTSPRDVDVLLVGDVSRDQMIALERTVSARVSKEVNVTRISREAWEDSSSPFLTTLRSRPLIPVEITGAVR